MMRYWLLWCCCLALPFVSHAQTDSVRVVIHLNPANDQIELSYGYQQARMDLQPLINMYNLQRGVKTLATQYKMAYDEDEDAWVTKVPWGFYELRVESLGFKDIVYPMRIKKDVREEFALDVDSTSYSYQDGKRYNYIMGTRHFNNTLIVRFKDEGDPAKYHSFLQAALSEEGFEYTNVLRIQKMRNTNTFLVNLEVITPIPLNIILYRKVTKQKPIEQGLIMGKAIAQAIEQIQTNPMVVYANPTFIEPSSKPMLPSSEMAKSAQLERKLLRLMEDDPAVLDKINYIIQKTTPPEESDSSGD